MLRRPLPPPWETTCAKVRGFILLVLHHSTHTCTLETRTRRRGKAELAVASLGEGSDDGSVHVKVCTWVRRDACFVHWLTGRSDTERMCWACCVASTKSVDCTKKQSLLDHTDRRCKNGTCNGLKVSLRDTIVGTVPLISLCASNFSPLACCHGCSFLCGGLPAAHCTPWLIHVSAVLYVQRWHLACEAGTVPAAHRRTNQTRGPEDDRH